MDTRMQTAKNWNQIQEENAKFAIVEVAKFNVPKCPVIFEMTAKANEYREHVVRNTTIVHQLVSFSIPSYTFPGRFISQ